MPKNKFPDSKAKRELRRQDARRLEQFKLQKELKLGLSYCGMPSIEFLDIHAWQKILSSVCAVELDEENLSDMRIQWRTLSLDIPTRFVQDNILMRISSRKRAKRKRKQVCPNNVSAKRWLNEPCSPFGC